MRHPALELAGTMSLRQLAAVLAQARLFVSVSTGPMHLASALQVPAVTLYGPTDLRFEVKRWSPYGSPQRAVLSPVACTCRRSMYCTNAICMPGITPEMVLDAADDLLSGADSGNRHVTPRVYTGSGPRPAV
jgi:heptosyltransferase-3